jgi:hypothetical protein
MVDGKGSLLQMEEDFGAPVSAVHTWSLVTGQIGNRWSGTTSLRDV